MPSPDLSALIRWPNVPACYGWLSLDRRGRWRLQGEPVTHQGFIEFINRQYGCDAAGNWFLQNGPQRVFVRLDYTPWILHLAADGELVSHTGQTVQAAKHALIDEDGALLIAFDQGLGVLDDRDLAAAYNDIRDARGQVVSDESLLAAIENRHETIWPDWFWRELPLTAITRADVAQRYRFVADPQA